MDNIMGTLGPSSVRYRTGRPGAAGPGKKGAGGANNTRKSAAGKTLKPASDEMILPDANMASLAAWGYVFQINTETVAVGANVTFNNNGPLNGINHAPDSAAIDVTLAGTYNITFSVYTTQNNPQDWGIAINGAVRSRFNSAGQTITGTASLTLNAMDTITIRNVNTIPDPATLRVGDFTTAYVLLYKIDS